MLLSLTFALVGIGVLQLPRHFTLHIAAALLFIAALLTALVNQAGI